MAKRTETPTTTTFQLLFLGAFLSLSFTGCNDKFMKQSARSKTSSVAELAATVDSAGNVTAEFDPNSSSIQVLKLSTGSLAGTAIAIPPGSLAIPVSITVGEGETLASSSFTQDLGLTDNSITAAGPSVSFIPSTNVEASSPFTLSIPMSTTTLAFALDSSDDNIVVMYRWMKVENGTTSYDIGIIPGSDVTVSSGKVSFQTTKFGVFQIGKAEKKITERVTKPTIEPPALKGDASNPLVGLWGMCRKVDFMGPKEGPVPTPEPIKISSVSSGLDMSGNPRIEFWWNGAIGAATVLKFDSVDCGGNPTESPSTEPNSFSDSSFNAGIITASYKVKDSIGRLSTCLAAPVVKEKIRLTGFSSPTMTSIDIYFNGGANPYTLDSADTDCTGPSPSSTSFTTSLISITSLTAGTIYKFKIKDTSGLKSTCITITSAPSFSFSSTGSPALTGVTYASTTLTLNSSTATTAQLFSDSTCNTYPLTSCTFASNTCNISYSTNFWPVYVKLSDGTNTPCLPIIKNYNTASWNRVEWQRVSSFSNGVEIDAALPTGLSTATISVYDGYDCSSASLTTYNFRSGKNVFNLANKSTSKFSFQAKDGSGNFISSCLNVMLPDATNDLSSGNKINISNTAGYLTVKMPFEKTVTLDPYSSIGIADPSNIVTTDSSKSANLYSTASSTTSIQLINSYPIAASSWVTLWAPPACHFTDAIGGSSPSLPITSANFSVLSVGGSITATALGSVSLVCDGQGGDGKQGDPGPGPQPGDGPGGDLFGFLPTGPFSVMNLVKISSSTFTNRKDYFTSTDCSGKPLSSITESGDYNLLPVDVAGTLPVDIITKSGSGIIFTPEGVEAANGEPEMFGCSMSGWEQGQSQSITSDSCVGVGTTNYSRFKIDGRRLYICGKAETAASRVTECSADSSEGVMEKK